MPYRYLNRTGETSYYHVFNRGNDKQPIFLSPSDYTRFLRKVRDLSREHNVHVLAYCLMPNHYHFLFEEQSQGDIARLMQRVNLCHAKWFNWRYKHIGHTFQGPYGERSVDSDAYLVNVSAYIHNNPIDLGVNPEMYEWSSLIDYIEGNESWLHKDPILGYFPAGDSARMYHDYVKLAAVKPGIKPGFGMEALAG